MKDDFYSFDCFYTVFNDYAINYDELLKIFKQQSVDNTELYFLKTQKKIYKHHFSELEEMYQEIYEYTEHTKYYVDFLRNRIFPLDILEQLDNSGETIDQETISWIGNYKEVDKLENDRKLCLNFLKKRLSTVDCILEFLKQRKQELEKESYSISGTNSFKNTRDKKHTTDQIALKMVYEGNTLVTREEHGNDLYNKVTYWLKRDNRTANDGSNLQLQNKIKRFEKVIDLLDDESKQRAIDEVKILKSYLPKN